MKKRRKMSNTKEIKSVNEIKSGEEKPMNETKIRKEEFLIEKKELIKYAGDTHILWELTAHRSIKEQSVSFPERFKVVIDESNPDDEFSTLAYYRENEDVPFMVMGYSDQGYLLVCALMRLLGR
jgi:hypothetical protein